MTSKLLIDEPPLQVIPSLAKIIGLDEAIILQQLHYWTKEKTTGKIIDGVKWIYNTYEKWKEDNFPFWSERTIQRTFLSLEEMGLVISKQFDKAHYDRKKYYRIDYDKVEALNDPKSILEDDKLAPSLNVPETTAETTTDITDAAKSAARETLKKGDGVDWALKYSRKPDPINDYDECYRPYLEVLRDKFGIDAPQKGERGWKMWCGELLILRRTCNNDVSQLDPVYADWLVRPWNVASPRNLERRIVGLRAIQKAGAGEKPRVWAQEY